MKETRKVLIWLLKHVWKKKPVLYGVYGLQFAAQVLSRLQLVVLPKFLLDELVLLTNGASAGTHLHRAAFYVGLTVGLGLLANLLTGLSECFQGGLTSWFYNDFRVILADQAMGMDFQYTEDPAALDQLRKAEDGVEWYSGNMVGILQNLYTVIVNLTVLCGVLALIVAYCPLLLPVQLTALALTALWNGRNNELDREYFLALSKVNRVFGYIYYRLGEFQYGKDIRLYDSADMMCAKAKKYAKDQQEMSGRNFQKKKGNLWKINGTGALRDGITYFYIGSLAMKGAITIGDFSLCISAASALYQSLSSMVLGWQTMEQYCSYASEFLKFMEYPSAMEKGDRQVMDGEHVIEFSHVSFRYPRSERYVLRDVNLTIRSGEHLSVVGMNGAGKTTFVKLLCRLYDVTEGEIRIDGVNIREYSEEEYRKLFAVVFQDFKLFAFSLRDNITLGTGGCDEEVNRVLRLSGFYDDAKKLEQGLDTMLYKTFDKQGTELSGGQRQKTAISRALYRNAPIVILDEPTAALDPVAEAEIYEKFHGLVENKTAVYISHRLSSCRFCDRIAVFEDGTIREYGTHEELVKKENGIYAEMFAAQAGYYVKQGA